MFDLLGLIAGIFAAKEIIEEKTTKPYPKITDWDEYWKLSGVLPRKEFEKLVYSGYFSTDKCVKDSDGNNIIEDEETYNEDSWNFEKRYVNKWENEGKYNYNTDWYEVYAESYESFLKDKRNWKLNDIKFTKFRKPECNYKSEEELEMMKLDICVRNEWGEKVIEDKETYYKDSFIFKVEYRIKWQNEGKYNFNTEWYDKYSKYYDLKNMLMWEECDWEGGLHYNSEGESIDEPLIMKPKFTEWKQPKCNIKTEVEVRQFEKENNIVHNKK